MKKLALAAAISAFASTSFAGGILAPEPEPVIEPEVVVEETAGTGGFVVPLLLLAVVIAIASD